MPAQAPATNGGPPTPAAAATGHGSGTPTASSGIPRWYFVIGAVILLAIGATPQGRPFAVLLLAAAIVYQVLNGGT